MLRANCHKNTRLHFHGTGCFYSFNHLEAGRNLSGKAVHILLHTMQVGKGAGDSDVSKGALLLYLSVSVLNIGIPERCVRLKSRLFHILIGSQIQ